MAAWTARLARPCSLGDVLGETTQSMVKDGINDFMTRYDSSAKIEQIIVADKQ